MQKKIKIETDKKIVISETIGNFLNPDYVYLPIIKNAKLAIDNSKKVYKGDQIFSSKDEVIFSPISGSLSSIVEKLDSKGNKVRFLVVENDFKEKTRNKKAIKSDVFNITKDKLIDIVKVFNPELSNLLNRDYKNHILVVRALDDEPYICTQGMTILNHTHDILELMDNLLRILELSESSIMLKSDDVNVIDKVINLVGSYPKIGLKIIDDTYPLNNPEIIKEIYSDDDLILSVNELLELISYIKKSKPIFEKYITISGNAIKNPMVINAKVGSSIKELIENIVEFKVNKKHSYYINGLMRGTKYDNVDSILVDKNLDGIIINNYEQISHGTCINCGLCRKVCPMKINPLCRNEKCINCNLCSYVCPARVDMAERKKTDE